MATNQGIITQVFPAHERGRALGISACAVALGSLVGPPLGGFIVSVLSWKFVFLINVPIGVSAYYHGREDPSQERSWRSRKSGHQGSVPVFIGRSVALWFIDIRGRPRGRQPAHNRRFHHSGNFDGNVRADRKKTQDTPSATGYIQEFALFAEYLLRLHIFCFHKRHNPGPAVLSRKYPEIVSGCDGSGHDGIPDSSHPLSPLSSGYLSDKIGSEFLTSLGLTLTSLGLFLMSTLDKHSSVSLIVVFVGIIAAGNGVFQSPNNSLVMSLVPRDKLGIAGSINALVRNLGMVFGVSMSTMLLYNRMSSALGFRVTNYAAGMDDAFVSGMKVGLCRCGRYVRGWCGPHNVQIVRKEGPNGTGRGKTGKTLLRRSPRRPFFRGCSRSPAS